ncbi:transmembrane protein 72 [Plakobranchus ocellatus]|uniref:Transmembrane protein 72 n=1 Tax=Plakobranchus ocellatus TaxID=259542 RepID=A0AAV4AAP0_9GAST|nr:transmembrane protein 72 [Plakobranchus ocellatus]
MGGASESCCWTALVVVCRFFGIVTALVLWGVGIEYVYYGAVFGVYFIAVAILTSFLEVVFMLDHVVEVCVSRTSLIVRLWDIVLWVDDWKKGVLYFVLFAPPCFVRPTEALLGVLSGILLVITGIFYMLKTFKTKKDEEDESLETNRTYDRFEDGPEDLDASISNPVSGPTGSGMISLADQSEILDL